VAGSNSAIANGSTSGARNLAFNSNFGYQSNIDSTSPTNFGDLLLGAGEQASFYQQFNQQ
jgi:hypothetical protein